MSLFDWFHRKHSVLKEGTLVRIHHPTSAARRLRLRVRSLQFMPGDVVEVCLIDSKAIHCMNIRIPFSQSALFKPNSEFLVQIDPIANGDAPEV